MKTASLELSKQLWKLSGWELPKSGTAWWYTYPDGSESLFAHEQPEHHDEAIEKVPAYPLGYLLRKLPNKSNISKAGSTYAAWVIRAKDATDYKDNDTFQEADTPEDAAAKLAIELFMQGIFEKKNEYLPPYGRGGYSNTSSSPEPGE